MRSLKRYFEHINGKTYIDKYPETVIKLDDLKKGTLVELGGGIGNDMRFLLDQGFSPDKLFFLELDKKAYNKAVDLLKEGFRLFNSHLLFKNAKGSGLASRIADFVYANNMLHCLEDKEEVLAIFREAYRLLRDNGIFFGRTLLDKIDEGKLKTLKSNLQSEKQKFALQTAEALGKEVLLGLSIEEIKEIGRTTGFSEIYTEIIPTTWAPTIDFYFRFKK